MHAYGHAIIRSLHHQFTIIQDIYVHVYGHLRPNGDPWCLINSQTKSLEQMTHTVKAFRTYIFYKVRLHDSFAQLALKQLQIEMTKIMTPNSHMISLLLELG